MRFRSRSIRAKLIALLLVPLVSLCALWSYTTVTSVSQVWSLMQVNSEYTYFGTPADDLSRALQDERRAAVAYTAAPLGQGDQTTLTKAEAATDKYADLVDARAADRSKVGGLNATERSALTGVVQEILIVRDARVGIAEHDLDWTEVYNTYTAAQDPFFTLRLALTDLSAGNLARNAADLVELVRAREYISEEDALMTGARAIGGFDQSELQEFLTAASGEQLLFQVHAGQLPPAQSTLYEQFISGNQYNLLTNLETEVSDLGTTQRIGNIDAAVVQSTYDTSLADLSQIDLKAASLAGADARNYAIGVISEQGVVGAIGLIAILLSLLLSLRIGRGLARDLVGLRDSAFELAGARLPSVMRRLREGEQVDLATEVPQVAAGESKGRDEIAQVGRAFNAVQRAAVEAAVEQAELRRGIAAVFVNLARRSQALLHRQLTLLDEMERRADQPEELADLFRLDHLTTRMRRHAEGLIILSGAAPGRSWRRPVRVLDVVRAAVGEVEDYARVRVHRMPPIAVVGGAVSDVIHLVAELVENATVFSPPHTQVRIQGELVANGFALEIDDRGLGMGEEAMTAANDRLATSGDFDLGDTDRLGLFVISRLSVRHGIRVSLRNSPYGGTTAVVLLPRELLTDVAPRTADVPAEPTSELVLPTARMRLGRELPQGAAVLSGPGALGGPRPTVVDEDAAGGLPRRRAALPSRADSYLASREGTAPAAVPAPSPAPVRPAAPAAEEQVTTLLPRRVRQANLAPQLREAAERKRSGVPDPEEPAARERSPEEIRSTFSSYQRGISRGRGAAVPRLVAARDDDVNNDSPSSGISSTDDLQTSTAPAEGPVR